MRFIEQDIFNFIGLYGVFVGYLFDKCAFPDDSVWERDEDEITAL